MDDYFDQVGAQLRDLCEQRSRRRAWLPRVLGRPMRAVAPAAAIAVTVIVFVFALVALSGRTSSTSGSQRTTRTPSLVPGYLRGIPQAGRELGRPNAPVTLILYGDLESPLTRYLTQSADFTRLIDTYVRPGTVKLVYRSLCTSTCAGPGRGVFELQQAAAYAAGMQDRFWEYALQFYKDQGSVEGTRYATTSYLDHVAAQVPGLDLTQWKQQGASRAILRQVRADDTQATADGITGTPTLIAMGPRGTDRLVPGLSTYGAMAAAIAKALGS
jgi:protein-disulfide isomerase